MIGNITLEIYWLVWDVKVPKTFYQIYFLEMFFQRRFCWKCRLIEMFCTICLPLSLTCIALLENLCLKFGNKAYRKKFCFVYPSCRIFINKTNSDEMWQVILIQDRKWLKPFCTSRLKSWTISLSNVEELADQILKYYLRK